VREKELVDLLEFPPKERIKPGEGVLRPAEPEGIGLGEPLVSAPKDMLAYWKERQWSSVKASRCRQDPRAKR